MKYIRIFESNSNEVTDIKFGKFERDREWCRFTQSEIDIIKDNIETAVLLSKKTDIDLNNGKFEMYYIDKLFISHFIKKYEDEWFTIRTIDYAGKELYYICDQFDELILLLRQLKK